jgi:hypothetical protein
VIIQIKVDFKTPTRQDQKRTSPCHITVKTLRKQNKVIRLKAAREKYQVTYQDKCHQNNNRHLKKTLNTRKAWS